MASASASGDRAERQRLRAELAAALRQQTTLSETQQFGVSQGSELLALLKGGVVELLRRAVGEVPFGAEIVAAFDGLQSLYRNHAELQAQLKEFTVKALLFQLDLADAVESGAVGGDDRVELAQRERVMLCLRDCHDLARRAAQQPASSAQGTAVRVLFAGARLDELRRFEKELADGIVWYTAHLGFKNAAALMGVKMEVKQVGEDVQQVKYEVKQVIDKVDQMVRLTSNRRSALALSSPDHDCSACLLTSK